MSYIFNSLFDSGIFGSQAQASQVSQGQLSQQQGQSQLNIAQQQQYAGQLQGGSGIANIYSSASTYWNYPVYKYSKEELKSVLGEEIEFFQNLIPLKGKISKVDSYIEIQEGRNIFLVGMHEVITVPVLDKMKQSKLYKLASPEPATFWQGYISGQLLASTGSSYINILP